VAAGRVKRLTERIVLGTLISVAAFLVERRLVKMLKRARQRVNTLTGQRFRSTSMNISSVSVPPTAPSVAGTHVST